jgi:Tol biopolymer transport system component
VILLARLACGLAAMLTLTIALAASPGAAELTEEALSLSQPSGIASSRQCPEVLLYGARGWGERSSDPLGKLVAETLSLTRSKIRRADVAVTAVQTAPPSPSLLGRSPRAYVREVEEAASEMMTLVLGDAENPCTSESQIGFVGYGSGAWVVRLMINALPARVVDRVVGVVLFGDPTADSAERLRQRFDPPSRHLLGFAHQRFVRRIAPPGTFTRFPRALASRVYNFCVVKDPVCAVPATDTLTAAKTARALRTRAARHRFYSAHNMDYGSGHWLAERIEDRSLDPGYTVQGGGSPTVGSPLAITVVGDAPRPPVTVAVDNLRGAARTGLRIVDNEIVGTPVRDGYFAVDITVTDGIGRTVEGLESFWVDYPMPVTIPVGEDAGQDWAGRKVGMPSISGDGKLVAFASGVPLVPADSNLSPDVYLRDLRNGALVLMSTDSAGAAAGDSAAPQLSADGSTVVFSTRSAVFGASAVEQVVVYDIATAEMDVIAAGTAPQVSSDGRLMTYLDVGRDVVVLDRGTGRSSTFADLDIQSESLRISGDGSTIVFATWKRLVAADTDDHFDVYLIHLAAEQARQLISVDRTGNILDQSFLWPSISDDGAVVAFTSDTGVHRKVLDPTTTQVNRGDVSSTGASVPRATALSGDGSVLMYDDQFRREYGNQLPYLFDQTDLTRSREVEDTRGGASDEKLFAWAPDMSADGRYVAFLSIPFNGPVDILVADMLVR